MKKVIIIFVIVILLAIAIFSNINYFYFNKRIEKIEKILKDKVLYSNELRNNIGIINSFSEKYIDIGYRLDNIEIEKIECIDYLHDTAIASNNGRIFINSYQNKIQ